MTTIGNNAFKGCTSLKNIYSNMLYPQSLGSGAFTQVPNDCVLHIPMGTLTAYKNAGWTKESTGITIIEEGEPEENFCLENPVTHDYIQIAQGSFRTEGTVRMLNIGYVYNFRDIGGWSLPNGRRVKYGKVFRTGELEIPYK